MWSARNACIFGYLTMYVCWNTNPGIPLRCVYNHTGGLGDVRVWLCGQLMQTVSYRLRLTRTDLSWYTVLWVEESGNGWWPRTRSGWWAGKASCDIFAFQKCTCSSLSEVLTTRLPSVVFSTGFTCCLARCWQQSRCSSNGMSPHVILWAKPK